MKQWLGTDSKLITLLNHLFDFVGLNAVFLLTCLPIITIPSAWSSLLTVKYRQKEQRDINVYRIYFQLFKKNIVTNIQLLVVDIVLLLVLVVLPSGLNLPILIPLQLLGLIVILVLLTYQFILVGLYEMTWRDVLRNCGFLFTSFPLETSLLIIINTLLVFLSVTSFLGILISFYAYAFGGFVAIAILNAWLLKRIFNRLSI